jgi:putative peptide zinc metalloprotease protein
MLGQPEGQCQATRAAAEMLGSGGAITLCPGVMEVQRRGMMLLVPTSDEGRPMRISGVGREIMPLLREGTTVASLVDFLHERYPAAQQLDRRVSTFVHSLAAAGLLANQPPGSEKRRWRVEFVDIDRLAGPIARVLNALPAGLGALLLLLAGGAALAGIIDLGQGGLRPHLSDVVHTFNASGVAALLLAVVPLHELGHAVACRAAGIRVTGAGLAVRGLMIVPYVNTRDAYALASRRQRFWIPAAGPLVDFVALGCAAWIEIATSARGLIGGAVHYLVILCIIVLCLDCSPFKVSDGRHALGVLIDDELAPKVAWVRRPSRLVRLSRPAAIWSFRAFCLLYVLSVAALIVWLSI